MFSRSAALPARTYLPLWFLLAGLSSGQVTSSSSCLTGGQVTDFLSGEAVRNVKLQLLPAGTESETLAAAERRQMGIYAPDSPAQYEATSAGDGRFCFTSVPPGQYTLLARKTGFLVTNYGSATPFQAGAIVDIQPNEAVTNLLVSKCNC